MLPEKIYALRRRSGLSQEQLAQRIGVSRQAISKWEGGQSTPELDKLKALSECFQVTMDELTGDGPLATGEGGARREGPSAPDAPEERGLGIGLCAAGAVCLILLGVLTIAAPSAADRLDASSMVTLRGTGLLALLCLALMAAGVVLLFKKR